ncbi:MAG: FMN-binding protein [Ruminococcaceae bacterium]|nr:FMN-binding protein [Oscillospiraceae bacterium]
MSKKKMNASLKSLIVLLSICLVIAVAMAAINMVTAPKIAEAEKQAEQEALRWVLSDAVEFEAVDGTYAESVDAVYRDTAGNGYAVMLSAKGYDSSNPMRIAAGFDADGRLLGCAVVSASGETSGIGTKVTEEDFIGQFGGGRSDLDGVDTISGATISSTAFLNAVQDAFDAVRLAKEVDA